MNSTGRPRRTGLRRLAVLATAAVLGVAAVAASVSAALDRSARRSRRPRRLTPSRRGDGCRQPADRDRRARQRRHPRSRAGPHRPGLGHQRRVDFVRRRNRRAVVRQDADRLPQGPRDLAGLDRRGAGRADDRPRAGRRARTGYDIGGEGDRARGIRSDRRPIDPGRLRHRRDRRRSGPAPKAGDRSTIVWNSGRRESPGRTCRS